MMRKVKQSFNARGQSQRNTDDIYVKLFFCLKQLNTPLEFYFPFTVGNVRGVSLQVTKKCKPRYRKECF
jgi:hypothetical protein